MSERVISPVGRGFLLLDSHPIGCAQTVTMMREQVGPPPGGGSDPRPTALVIGSSAGYGLASTVAAIARYGMNGVGVCFERAPSQRRTATAGWYRTVAAAELAAQTGSEFSFRNADAFADTTKDEVLDLVAQRFGGVDYLIYSVAAPRRSDPRTGQTYQSAIKPIGSAHQTKTVQFADDSTAELRDAVIEPAEDAEVADTVQVMGGEDWARWVDALAGRQLLKPGFATVALTYIGSSLTAPIYREGSIGAAKAHLEGTAAQLMAQASTPGFRAFTSVNGAAVTQASSAIPGIGFYISLLHRVLGSRMQSPIEQSVRLWDQLVGTAPLDTDDEGRIRLDRWEMDLAVQDAVREVWAKASQENLTEVADTVWFHDEVYRLYGFQVPGVDYAKPCDPDVPWPAG
ncbi:MAG: enoyl-[acyl-carrier-protein] reductase FabV [Sporichthyaceae bacterium]|nr:enoyl-[acyl-carrier-protein] reductase FabV [Sporichthyaceae bacterium]